VVLTKSAEGYAVNCPALPGCWSEGGTRDEALANIRDAIRLWLEVAEEDGANELHEIEFLQQYTEEQPKEVSQVCISNPDVVVVNAGKCLIQADDLREVIYERDCGPK
jgi:predicted RNase H-like HicB family nuclease